MACQRFADAVRAHAAGGELNAEVRAHLDLCDGCRLELEREQRLLAGIEADLSGALRVEPSVEFEARVRQRIAANPAEAGFHTFVESAFRRITRLQFALATASLVVLVAATAFVVFQPVAPGPPLPAGTVIVHSERWPSPSAGATRPAAPLPDARAHRDQQPIVDSTRVAGARRLPTTGYRLPAAAREPEVLIDPGQRAALNNLLALIRAGKVDDKTFPAPAPENADLTAPAQVVAPIVVEDLKVPPITVPPATGTTEKR